MCGSNTTINLIIPEEGEDYMMKDDDNIYFSCKF